MDNYPWGEYVPLYYVTWKIGTPWTGYKTFEKRCFLSTEERNAYLVKRGWKWWERLPFISRTFYTD